MHRSHQSGTHSPGEICIAALIDAIEAQPLRFLSRRGNIAIDVEDDRAFTIRFGDNCKPLDLEGADETADLRMTLSRDTMGRMLDGSLVASAALRARTLQIRGDAELLPELAALFATSRTSVVGVRASAAAPALPPATLPRKRAPAKKRRRRR